MPSSAGYGKKIYIKQTVMLNFRTVYVVIVQLSTMPLDWPAVAGLFLTACGDFYMFCAQECQSIGNMGTEEV
jgi:hypothetical protein